MLVSWHLQAADIWLETENFSDKGGWVVDQQFMDLMGSPYLMAHGLGRKVADACTMVNVPTGGQWHVYVRTFNWTSPWTAEDGPGAFKVRVGEKMLKTVLGVKGDSWQWQYAGKVNLKAGETSVSLCDMTGFNGRCDAVYMTMDAGDVPPSDPEALALFRREKLHLPSPQVKEYEFVVIGGGIAGMCAAVSAARLVEAVLGIVMGTDTQELVAIFHLGLGIPAQIVGSLAAGMDVDSQLVTALAAQQIVNRGIQSLALDVPQGHVDGRQGTEQNGTAPPEGAAENILPDVGNIHGILSHQNGLQMLEHAVNCQLPGIQGGFADAGDAFVGVNTDVVVVAAEECFNAGDLHGFTLL